MSHSKLKVTPNAKTCSALEVKTALPLDLECGGGGKLLSSLRDLLVFDMLPWLPAFVEGLLDYSPADDEASVLQVLGDRRIYQGDEAALGATLGIPSIRVGEALTRLRHREIEGETATGNRDGAGPSRGSYDVAADIRFVRVAS